MFGTLESALLNTLHGYTGRRAGHLTGYDAQASGVINVGELYEILSRFLIDEYADKVNINFEPLSYPEFYHRLSHAAGYRWGLVIEMLIEALTACLVEKAKEVFISHFERAFEKIYGIPTGYSPFTIDNFANAFEPENLMELIDRTQ